MTSFILLAAISREMLLAVIALPTAIAVGFTIGMLYERWFHFSSVQKLGKRFEKLFRNVSKTLENAELACQVFNQRPEAAHLNTTQQTELKSITEKLTDELNKIAESCQAKTRHSKKEQSPTENKSAAPSRTKPILKTPFQLPRLKRKPVDERTAFPDATAYDHNLQKLLRAMKKTDCKSAAMFIKLDQYSKHVSRYGDENTNAFLKKAGKIVLRHLKENSVVHQVSEDLLIAIVPNIKANVMQKLANNVRKAIRSHKFVKLGTSTEVFVTASFSYSLFGSQLAKNETPDHELWDRCQSGLAASQKQGRCQLHEMTNLGTSRLIAG